MGIEKFIHKVKNKIKQKIGQNKFSSDYDAIIFRNDDVSYDSNVKHFKEMCEVFHRYGFVQLHAINLYGLTNCSYIKHGIPCLYDDIEPDDIYKYDVVKRVSKHYYIGDNQEFVDYINSIPDPVALHGLYHSDYSIMTYEEQDHDIGEGLHLMHQLFPEKIINTFVAPFNHTNEFTYQVCKKYGLRVSQLEGEHLEEMMSTRPEKLQEGQLYRYHHHRFYPETTFSYYDLSIEKLDKFFAKYSYTVMKNGKVQPSVGLLQACVNQYKASHWYVYAYKEFMNRKHAYLAYKWIRKNISHQAEVLEVACGAGGMLYHLHAAGFENLSGYDYDDAAINVCKTMAKTISAPINCYRDDAYNPQEKKKQDVIIWVNGMYHLDNYTLDMFYENHIAMAKENTYFIFDMVDIAFNHVKNNEYATQDWEKSINEKKRPSEYKLRMSDEEVIKVAKKYGCELEKKYAIKDVIPRNVYVFKRKKPKICLYCDRPNWAHHNSAIEIKKYLSDEFDLDILYVVDKPKIKCKKYDAVLVFFWGEPSIKKMNLPKKKIIKQVSSHRWEDDPLYGPCDVEAFQNKYLMDAGTVICPSMILYNLLKPVCDDLFLCGKGYSPEKFFYEKERSGEMKLCMVGNLNDPVKGVKDLLLPAAEGFNLELANDIKHEELRAFYNRKDVYVVSSRHEADPLPLIESMACGCFPVASYVGIAPELIRHKVNGYLVKNRTVEEFRQAFTWCKENLDYIRKQGRSNAQEMYDTRRWDFMANNYRNMFREHFSRM